MNRITQAALLAVAVISFAPTIRAQEEEETLEAALERAPTQRAIQRPAAKIYQVHSSAPGQSAPTAASPSAEPAADSAGGGADNDGGSAGAISGAPPPAIVAAPGGGVSGHTCSEETTTEAQVIISSKNQVPWHMCPVTLGRTYYVNMVVIRNPDGA